MNISDEYKGLKRVNTLPFTSHFIPFDFKDKVKCKFNIIDKFSSSRVINLDGLWRIKEYPSIKSIKSLDIPFTQEIYVPSVVQLNGFDHIQYVNHRYPFPYNPPVVPLNHTYHYQKFIKIKLEDNFLYHLNFEGVDSAFYLFINNQKVGYSLISHSTSAFDITKYLVNGQNKIDVVVLKWNPASYLEDQDKFRFTGIFRDLYIIKRPKKYIEDFKIITDYSLDNKGIFKFINLSNIDLNVDILNKHILVKSNQDKEIIFNNIEKWDASNPKLYQVTISSKDEVVYEYVGFRNIKIENGVFKINHIHEKLKGVNRHESNPVTGATVTLEDTYKDLKLIKECNCNAIRTSHYPDIPEFYDLCNKMGIYVLDEADVESHGATGHKGGYDLKEWQRFANSGIFDEAVFDREVSLYERDKNKTCVVIFSLGNESSYGKMFYKGQRYIKDHDSRPIHYEGLWDIVGQDEYYIDEIDIVSRMYPNYEWLTHGYLDDPKEKRPLVLCEYSHAMGNSCGDIRKYWDIINSNDRFIGGFVWEWCDHAVLVDNKLLYGGDNNEKLHDGNFCVDGLVTAFRELKSSTLEMKEVYANKPLPKLIDKTSELVKLDNDNPIKVEINKTNGDINQIIYKNKNLLVDPIKINYLRAPLDNDMFDKKLFNQLKISKINISNFLKNKKRISYDATVKHYKKGTMLSYSVCIDLYNKGIDISISYKLGPRINIPRMGISFTLNKNYKEFSYFGFGDKESYVDKHSYAKIKEYYSNSESNYNHFYLKPQENGSHYYTSYINFNNLNINASKPFSFSILPYSIEQISSAKHDYELRSDNNVYVCLDLFMSGVGTHSCGPVLSKEYRVPKTDKNTFRFIFDK